MCHAPTVCLHLCIWVAIHVFQHVRALEVGWRSKLQMCDNMENNTANQHKPHKKRGVERLKLAVAAKCGKRRDWTKSTISHCLDVMGDTHLCHLKEKSTGFMALSCHHLPWLCMRR